MHAYINGTGINQTNRETETNFFVLFFGKSKKASFLFWPESESNPNTHTHT